MDNKKQLKAAREKNIVLDKNFETYIQNTLAVNFFFQKPPIFIFPNL